MLYTSWVGRRLKKWCAAAAEGYGVSWTGSVCNWLTLDNVLNASERDFLTLTDVTVEPLAGGPVELHAFLTLARRHIVFAVAASETPKGIKRQGQHEPDGRTLAIRPAPTVVGSDYGEPEAIDLV